MDLEKNPGNFKMNKQTRNKSPPRTTKGDGWENNMTTAVVRTNIEGAAGRSAILRCWVSSGLTAGIYSL